MGDEKVRESVNSVVSSDYFSAGSVGEEKPFNSIASDVTVRADLIMKRPINQ
jgi:hypothetical protein